MATDTTIIEFLLEAKDSTSEAFESFHSRLDGIGEHLTRIGEIAAGFLGAELFLEATGGVERFGSALISTNMEAERFQNTLQGLYGNAAQAKDAFAWLTANEQAVPFNIESIQQAAMTVVGFGGNIQEVMKPLEAMASVMGVTLPTAAQALMDAHSGLWRMMERDLHVTKEELASTGKIAVDTAGHVTGDLDAAFAAYVNHRYPDALSLQMNTLGGALSSLESQFTYLERELGQGVFNAVKTDVQDLTAYMKENKQEIANYAAVVGSALGAVAIAVFEVAKAIGTTLFEAVVVLGNLWQQVSGPVSTAFALVGSIVTAFTNWFTSTALPMIETALGVMATWWDSHQQAISDALTNIMGDVKLAFGYIAEQAANVMEIVGGAFDIGWGVVEILFGGILAVLSGNFDQFGQDLDDGTNKIMTGIINGFAGVLKYVSTWAVDLIALGASAMLPLADKLYEPWTKLAQGIRELWKGVGSFIGDVTGDIVSAMATMVNVAINGINKLIDGANSLPSWIPGFGGHHFDDLTLMDPEASKQKAISSVTDMFAKSAPGIDPWQKIYAGLTQDEAKANIKAQADAILAPQLADIEARRKALLAEYNLAPPVGGGNAVGDAAANILGMSDQQLGAGILDRFKGWLDQLLKVGAPGTAPGLPGGGGNVNGDLNVHGGLTGPDLPNGGGGFFGPAWGALGPQISTPTPPPEMAGGTSFAVANAASNLLDSLKDDTTEVGGVSYAVINAASNLADGIARMNAAPGGPSGFFAGAWAALGPQVADVAQAAAGAAGLKSPTFVGGYDDPGLSAGRGSAAVRLGFVGANDSQKQIAMLEAQVSQLEQQNAYLRSIAGGITEIAANTNQNHPANAAARTGLFAGAWGANRAGGL